MERLIIKNFLTIKHAEIDVRDFTILIGPQATGKSVIAKLLYFFRVFVKRDILPGGLAGRSPDQLAASGKERFRSLFRGNVWNNRQFDILYLVGDTEIAGVRNSAARSPIDRVEVYVSEELEEQLRMESRRLRETTSNVLGRNFNSIIHAYLLGLQDLGSHIEDPLLRSVYKPTDYIPAGRSFISLLQHHALGIVGKSIEVDPIIVEFGQLFQNSRIASLHDADATPPPRTWTLIQRRINFRTQMIIGGTHVVKEEDGQDWIERDGHSVRLRDASSGQQEVLPMLLSLRMAAWNGILSDSERTVVIEEPEAHLFPATLREIVELLALLRNECNLRFFVTTHSPYILSAVNILSYAEKISREGGAKVAKDVAKIVKKNLQIPLDRISAYSIDNGTATDIVSREDGLIGASVLDDVSNDFDEVFSRLLAIEVKHRDRVH